MATNFDLAPPAKTVNGLVAVPIDIQSVTARLVFDGATSSGSGDVTLAFVMGTHDGNPIFDLRQTITAAWLDGAALPVAKLAQHDFGGGLDAQLRIVESVLVAGSSHTLRVTYSLGQPQASMFGSYPPGISWTAGPRLAFNFGFTDLVPGRYLESWIPANLIFDQFSMVLDLQILNTTISHTVITNGTVTPLGTNHWSVAFPARFTALSPLLELRATNTLAGLTDTVTLPVSGTVVTIEAWKLTTGTDVLATQISNLKTWLADNENNVGPYIHGNRFVVFFKAGGMEYEGGTTATGGTLQHESFHSWWARGVKPASQPDGWFDEAWTTFNVDSPSSSLPFDFSQPSVELCSRNPWVRQTAAASYSAGYRFFQGVAAWLGVAGLKSLMKEFYAAHQQRPITTTELEEFLVSRSGNELLVDAFHRFIYGFADPSPAPDLCVHDAVGDPGNDLWAGTFWDSPDLWVRNADDNGTAHQAPEFGQDNWFYARVKNRSATATAKHFLVSFNVKSFAGTQFQYPADFLPSIAAASGFDLGPGQTAIVKARWPAAFVPVPGTHACLVAAALTRSEHPVSGLHVWEHNNLAQKNLNIVDLAPNDSIILPFVLAYVNASKPRRYVIELVRPKKYPRVAAGLLHGSGKAFAGIPGLQTHRTAVLAAGSVKAADAHFRDAVEAPFAVGAVSQVPVSIGPQEQYLMGLRVQVPADAKRGDVLRMDVIQRDPDGKTILGGVALEIRVR